MILPSAADNGDTHLFERAARRARRSRWPFQARICAEHATWAARTRVRRTMRAPPRALAAGISPALCSRSAQPNILRYPASFCAGGPCPLARRWHTTPQTRCCTAGSPTPRDTLACGQPKRIDPTVSPSGRPPALPEVKACSEERDGRCAQHLASLVSTFHFVGASEHAEPRRRLVVCRAEGLLPVTCLYTRRSGLAVSSTGYFVLPTHKEDIDTSRPALCEMPKTLAQGQAGAVECQLAICG